jgi:hypothetical protein
MSGLGKGRRGISRGRGGIPAVNNQPDLDEVGSTANNKPVLQQPFDLDAVAKKYKNLGGVPFTGIRTIMEAQAWLKSCERIFMGLELADNMKRFLASWLLKDEALIWWEAVMVGDLEIDTTWARYKKVFEERFVPRKEVKRLHDEFANLQQGDRMNKSMTN